MWRHCTFVVWILIFLSRIREYFGTSAAAADGRKAPFVYAGCYSHKSQQLILQWETSGFTWEKCMRYASNVHRSKWFVLEYPEGYESSGTASCGVFGVFDSEGLLSDTRCETRNDANDRRMGGRAAFALYASTDVLVQFDVRIDNVMRTFYYVRENANGDDRLSIAVSGFLKFHGIEQPRSEIVRGHPLYDTAVMRVLGIDLTEWLSNDQVARSRLIGNHQRLRLRSATRLGGEAKMYLVHEEDDVLQNPRYIFKDRSRFWATQQKLMWDKHVSLTTVMKSIVRESFVDELMEQMGLYDVYESTQPAALCVYPSNHSDTVNETTSTCGANDDGQRVLGILQRFHTSEVVANDSGNSEMTTAKSCDEDEDLFPANEDASAIGDIRALFRSGRFDRATGGEIQGERGRVLSLGHVNSESFDKMSLFWFVTGHPDLHGGNIMLHRDGHLSCVDADMAFDGSPGCLFGFLQTPCVFGVVNGFSVPCIFQEDSSRTGRHDECPYFEDADRPFLSQSFDLVLDRWNATEMVRRFFRNESVARDACESAAIPDIFCPSIVEMFDAHVVAMFELRISVLRELLERQRASQTREMSIRETYKAFVALFFYRLLSSNVASNFEPSDFKFRDRY
eukprot:g2556.t1